MCGMASSREQKVPTITARRWPWQDESIGKCDHREQVVVESGNVESQAAVQSIPGWVSSAASRELSLLPGMSIMVTRGRP